MLICAGTPCPRVYLNKMKLKGDLSFSWWCTMQYSCPLKSQKIKSAIKGSSRLGRSWEISLSSQTCICQKWETQFSWIEKNLRWYQSRVRVSMFYYNATRDSDVWLQTPIVTVSVRYGKEMKVPFVATLDMGEFDMSRHLRYNPKASVAWELKES